MTDYRRIGTVMTLLASLSLSAQAEDSRFFRGDANADGAADLSDAVGILTYLFLGGGDRPDCLDALDVSDDGNIDITDPIYLLSHLFLGGPAPSEPFLGRCGLDRTEDPLDCRDHAPCRDVILVHVQPGLDLHALWSEGYDTVEEQHVVHSVVRLKEGSFVVYPDRDTEDLGLIESLYFGPSLEEAAPVDGGTFHFRPDTYHEYRQSFLTGSGAWTFSLTYRLTDARHVILDCGFLDPCGGFGSIGPAFSAELETPQGRRSIFYSCFCPGDWTVAGNASLALALEDGTSIEMRMESSYLFRGVAGETSNRRLARALVDFRGRSMEIREYGRLVYAALHHNWNQEYRILFDEPIDGVYGIDVVDCPPPASPPPCMGTSLKSKAYHLSAALERTEELGIDEVGAGNP